MTTKKKAAKNAAPKPKAAPKPLRPMPADWDGPSAWMGKSPGYRLVAANILDDEKLVETMRAEEPDSFGPEAYAPIADRWLTERLTDAERAEIAAFVLAVGWVDHIADAGATTAQLTLPEALRPIVTVALNTNEAIWSEFEEHLLPTPEPEAAPTTAPTAAQPPASAPVVEATGQIVAITEPEKPVTIKPMAFRTSEEVGVIRRALENELKHLEELTKKNEAAGLLNGAKDARDRVRVIKTQLLPQVTAQQNLPFHGKESLSSMVARTIAGEVRARAKASLMKSVTPKKGESQKDAQQRQLAKLDDLEALIGNIAEQVGALCIKFLDAAADRGITVGKQALAAEPSTVAREAIQLVEFELQSGRSAG